MRIAFFGKHFDPSFSPPISSFINRLQEHGAELVVEASFYELFKERFRFENIGVVKGHEEIKGSDFLISIGGDGTVLDAIPLVRDSKIPILGINTGRLGFLSNINVDKVLNAADSLIKGAFDLDERSLLQVDCNAIDFKGHNFALNEVTIHKKDTSSMITIHTYLDDTFVNSYWADGLIIGTPTGSTAYSLSCGGPIIMPGSQNTVLTPIAPHNLNVRPLVIPNSGKLSLTASGRDESFFLTLDSRSFSVPNESRVTITKSEFSVFLVNLKEQNFFSTIRNKLLWGIDRRN